MKRSELKHQSRKLSGKIPSYYETKSSGFFSRQVGIGMTSAQAHVQPAIGTFSGRFPLYDVYPFLISLHSGRKERSGIVQQILHSVRSFPSSLSLSQSNSRQAYNDNKVHPSKSTYNAFLPVN
jgi:hypothetical protein